MKLQTAFPQYFPSYVDLGRIILPTLQALGNMTTLSMPLWSIYFAYAITSLM